MRSRKKIFESENREKRFNSYESKIESLRHIAFIFNDSL